MGSSPYSRLDRPPLSEPALRRGVLAPGGLWTRLEVRPETGSTNADAVAAARAGAAEGLVIVAETQTAGRGRLDRSWQSPPRAGLAVSVLLRPGPAINLSRYGWLPLLAGVALVETVRRLGTVDAVLKWPNDLLIDERKCAGILAESVPENAVVIGAGLNVTLAEDELPVPETTSLALSGSTCTDRDPLLRGYLRALADWYPRWRDADGDATACGLRDAYRSHCATLNRRVDVSMPGGTVLSAVASEVDSDGRLVVTGPDGRAQALAAGEIRHLRAI